MCDTNKQIRTEIVLVLVLYFEYARHFLWFSRENYERLKEYFN